MKMQNLLLIVGWLFGTTVLVGLVLRWWSGDHLTLVRYTGYLMPWLLIGLLPCTLWAGTMHHRGLALVLGISVVLIAVAYAPVFLSRPAASACSNAEFKVLSYNIWSENTHIDQVARNIHQQQPNIVLLQEVTP
ncbi:MAG: hypothetical protein R2864_14075, partial [Syntrophotaleaceae bacterium]